ncbi:hypothetical protein IKQ38_02085 [Candidatus Saccharibacteria bacterium]|nr:hypothetical protein [Candidatus Saccharibacteria bacterium]
MSLPVVLSTIQSQINSAGADTGAETDVTNTVGTALNVVFGIVAIIAVVMIVIGGISYATSQGDPGKVSKGKSTIIYGIIGMLISLLAFAIVNFVFKGL